MIQLEPPLAAEIAELSARYGQPRLVIAPISPHSFQPVGKPDRYGEVCMAIRRANERIIVTRANYYPPAILRLPTGGIGHGESIEAALLREVAEETGLTVVIEQFVALIAYQRPITPDGGWEFLTALFLLRETGGELASHDPDERTEAFGEVTAPELRQLAERLVTLPDQTDAEIGGSWYDWGNFRAVVHSTLAKHLKT